MPILTQAEYNKIRNGFMEAFATGVLSNATQPERPWSNISEWAKDIRECADAFMEELGYEVTE